MKSHLSVLIHQRVLLILTIGKNTLSGGGILLIKLAIESILRRGLLNNRSEINSSSLERVYRTSKPGNMARRKVYYAFDYEDNKPWLWLS